MKQRFFKTGLTLILAMLMVCISACTVGNSGTPTDTTEECSSTTSSETTPETTDGSPESPTDPAKNAVTILYTNDIHAYLNNDATSEKSLSYAEIAQMKKDLGEYVLLVDAGDHVQGAVYGAMDQGQSVLEIMDVKIYNKEAKAYVDLDLTKTYIVAGANYTLTSRGGGFNMVNGQTVKDYIVEDYMALAAYAIAFDDVDNDDLSDITSANSPLRVYENYTINYESPDGTNRVNVEKQMS